MKEEELKEIIANGENSGVEFKETRINPEHLAKEVAAFCNLQGGLILFGVRDDGEIVGIMDENLGDWSVEICRSGLIEPEVIPFIENIKIDNKTVCVVKISQGIDKPYCVKKNKKKTYYIRAFASVREATREELGRLYQASCFIHYDTTPVLNALLKDLSIDKIEEYFGKYRSINIKNLPQEEKITILINAEILCEVDKEIIVPTLAGMLIFGKEPSRFLTQCGIKK